MKKKLQFFQNSSTALHSERVFRVELLYLVGQLFYMHYKGAVPAIKIHSQNDLLRIL